MIPARPFEPEVPDWSTLMESFVQSEDTAESFTKPAYIFRGQACRTWDLRPSLTRVLQAANVTSEADALAVERSLIKEFKKRAHEYLNAAIIPADDAGLAWRALMQHYGAPTRILDWTASPYVATYFAVESHPDCSGAVWIIHARTIEEHFDSVPHDPAAVLAPGRVDLAKAPPRVYFGLLSRLTDRMAAQQTEPVVSSRLLADQTTYISEAVPEVDASKKFIKLVIPKELKLPFLRLLRRLNITGSSLFPGMDGWGRSIRELANLEALLRAKPSGVVDHSPDRPRRDEPSPDRPRA